MFGVYETSQWGLLIRSDGTFFLSITQMVLFYIKKSETEKCVSGLQPRRLPAISNRRIKHGFGGRSSATARVLEEVSLEEELLEPDAETGQGVLEVP